MLRRALPVASAAVLLVLARSSFAQAPEPPAPAAVTPPPASPAPIAPAPSTALVPAKQAFPGTQAPPATVTAASPSPPTGSVVELTSLRLMRDKGIITQAEYDSAMADIAPSTGDRAADAMSIAVGKWSTTIYGFAETDVINDSTESFNDTAGNALIARPNGIPPLAANLQNNYAGNHGRTQMSIRNSRLGLRMRAPEVHRVRVSGLVETDFEGYLPAPNPTTGSSESQFFSSPTLRLRHAFVRVETPVVDLLVGQYWDLFGWQNVYHPNSVQVQGLPGELYSRDAQVRLSHAFESRVVNVEIALAARRPPSRDSQIPEGQGGLRIAFPGWTGVTTTGATATDILPASVALTGDYRQFGLPEFSSTPSRTVALTTEAVAVDVFIPVIPARRGHEANSLSLTGEFVTGNGISDLYTGLTGGITFPTYVNASSVSQAQSTTYPQDIDNGMVTYDLQGNLHPIQWTTFIAGLQYYLPFLDGHVWVSGNVARLQSNNISQFTRCSTMATSCLEDPTMSYYPLSNAQVFKSENFFDANLFWQAVPGVRFGFEYANFNQEYGDGVHAINNRFQGSGFFIF
jgi:hypothetical protein